MKDHLLAISEKVFKYRSPLFLALGFMIGSYALQHFAKANYQDGQVDGCNKLIQITPLKVLDVTCSYEKDTLVISSPRFEEKVNVETGEVISE